MAKTETGKVGTAENLRLALSFKLFENTTLVGPKEAIPAKAFVPWHASLSECVGLLRSVDRVIALAEAASNQVNVDDLFELGELHRAFEYVIAMSSKSRVIKLRYGSPLNLQVLLSALTVPGLGMLLYGMKRLFGLDLEFKAYREERRVEYLEAKRIAEALSGEGLVDIDAQLGRPSKNPPYAWHLESGVLEDESKQD